MRSQVKTLPLYWTDKQIRRTPTYQSGNLCGNQVPLSRTSCPAFHNTKIIRHTKRQNHSLKRQSIRTRFRYGRDIGTNQIKSSQKLTLCEGSNGKRQHARTTNNALFINRGMEILRITRNCLRSETLTEEECL